MLTAFDPKIQSFVCMKYSTGFIIALDVDETFLKGGRICLCWLAGKNVFHP